MAGLTSCWEQTVLTEASLSLCDTRRCIGGTQYSRAKMPIGVEEKQVEGHFCSLCQKLLRLVIVPALGVRRSAPYRRMGATSDFGSLWER